MKLINYLNLEEKIGLKQILYCMECIRSIVKLNFTTMLKLSLCDYSDVYIFVKRTITIANSAAEVAGANNTNKKVIIKNCAHLLTL